MPLDLGCGLRSFCAGEPLWLTQRDTNEPADKSSISQRREDFPLNRLAFLTKTWLEFAA